MVSKIMMQDFDYIQYQNINLKKFNNTYILITGATGYIGSYLVHFFNYIKQKGIYVNLILLVRDVDKAKNMFKNYNVRIFKGNIEERIDIPLNIDYIFHCAAITSSKIMISNPEEVYNGIVIGTQNIVKMALMKNIKSMVYLSSMEVYGVMDGIAFENKLGFIDKNKARSCYPLGKRKAESICVENFQKHNLSVKIARLAQTFGPGIFSNDNRVFAQFARSVVNNKDIVLHTYGTTIGNYCYIADTVYGLIKLLLEGVNGEIYNIVNENNTMSIKDMAQIVSEISKGKSKVKFDIDKENIFGYASETHLKLSGKKMKNIGFHPYYNMRMMYKNLIEDYLSNNCVKRL